MCVASDVAADNNIPGGGEVPKPKPAARRRSQVALAVTAWLTKASSPIH